MRLLQKQVRAAYKRPSSEELQQAAEACARAKTIDDKWLAAVTNDALCHWAYHCAWALRRLGLTERLVWQHGDLQGKSAQELLREARQDSLSKPLQALLALGGEVLAEMLGLFSRAQWYLEDRLDVCGRNAARGKHDFRLRDQVLHTLDLPGELAAQRADDCESLSLSCYLQSESFLCWCESVSGQLQSLPPLLALVVTCALKFYRTTLVVGSVAFGVGAGDPVARQEVPVAEAREFEAARRGAQISNETALPRDDARIQCHVFCLLVPSAWLRARGAQQPPDHTVGQARRLLAAGRQSLPLLPVDCTVITLANQNLLAGGGVQPLLREHFLYRPHWADVHLPLPVHTRQSPYNTQSARGYRDVSFLFCPQDDSSGQFAVRAGGYPGSDELMSVGAPMCCLLDSHRSCRECGGGRNCGSVVDLLPVGQDVRDGVARACALLQAVVPPPLLPVPLTSGQCQENYHKIITGSWDDKRSRSPCALAQTRADSMKRDRPAGYQGEPVIQLRPCDLLVAKNAAILRSRTSFINVTNCVTNWPIYEGKAKGKPGTAPAKRDDEATELTEWTFLGICGEDSEPGGRPSKPLRVQVQGVSDVFLPRYGKGQQWAHNDMLLFTRLPTQQEHYDKIDIQGQDSRTRFLIEARSLLTASQKRDFHQVEEAELLGKSAAQLHQLILNLVDRRLELAMTTELNEQFVGLSVRSAQFGQMGRVYIQ
eukprot:g66715.t1